MGGQSPTSPSTSWSMVQPVLWNFAISCAASTAAELLTYPLDLTKTRLQIQGEAAQSSTSSLAPARRGMTATAIAVVRDEGVLKLWNGVNAAIIRHFVYSGSRMAAYEHLRENVFRRSPDGTFPLWKAATCAACAGGFGQFLASPTDLVKVQMQMEGIRRLQVGVVGVASIQSSAFLKYLMPGTNGTRRRCLACISIDRRQRGNTRTVQGGRAQLPTSRHRQYGRYSYL